MAPPQHSWLEKSPNRNRVKGKVQLMKRKQSNIGLIQNLSSFDEEVKLKITIYLFLQGIMVLTQKLANCFLKYFEPRCISKVKECRLTYVIH